MSTKPKKDRLSTAKPVEGTCRKTGNTIVFDMLSDVEKEGFSMGHVSSCCKGKRATHKGHTWKYLPTLSKREQLMKPEQYTVPILSLSEDMHTGIFSCIDCHSDYSADINSVRQGFALRCCECSLTYRQGRKTTHPRLYRIWSNMKTRCYNTNSESYKNYGGRGVTICSNWYTSIDSFIGWAETNGYADDLTIDRIDGAKGYSPENCRWTTREVQARNTRKLMSTNTSGFRGVSWNACANKWQSDIRVNNKTKYLGVYMEKEDAAMAYDAYITVNQLEHTKNFVSPEPRLQEVLNERN